jgi:hypothetical protein
MTSFRELPRRVKGIVPFSGILSNIWAGRDSRPNHCFRYLVQILRPLKITFPVIARSEVTWQSHVIPTT